MKKLFDELSFNVSKSVTEKYSTSFSLGILALKTTVRPAIYAIYGYVRLADEIVDSFHDYDKAKLLDRFKAETWTALDEGISLNPVLQSFQQTVKRFGIDRKLIEQFLHSMEMDLHQLSYDEERYQKYILGSAEVVGLMCLHVFVDGNHKAFETLKPNAMNLGSAFQKVNFLRDIKDDVQTLGRCYFPNVQMDFLTAESKLQIEKEIQIEFDQALLGIKKLPVSSRFGVYLAYKYYLSLFNKIKKTPADQIMTRRIRIHNGQKLSIAMSSYVQYKLAIA